MNNSLNIVKNFLKQQTNPKDLLLTFMQQNNSGNNTTINNLIQMAQQGKTKEVETFARNALKEQGRDFDKEFLQFKNYFKC